MYPNKGSSPARSSLIACIRLVAFVNRLEASVRAKRSGSGAPPETSDFKQIVENVQRILVDNTDKKDRPAAATTTETLFDEIEEHDKTSRGSLLDIAASRELFCTLDPKPVRSAATQSQKVVEISNLKSRIDRLGKLRETAPDATEDEKLLTDLDPKFLDVEILANLEYLLLRQLGFLLVHLSQDIYQRLLCVAIVYWVIELFWSEYKDRRRIQSTTWPWNIKPSLVVLWGVNWQFATYYPGYPHPAAVPAFNPQAISAYSEAEAGPPRFPISTSALGGSSLSRPTLIIPDSGETSGIGPDLSPEDLIDTFEEVAFWPQNSSPSPQCYESSASEPSFPDSGVPHTTGTTGFPTANRRLNAYGAATNPRPRPGLTRSTGFNFIESGAASSNDSPQTNFLAPPSRTRVTHNSRGLNRSSLPRRSAASPGLYDESTPPIVSPSPTAIYYPSPAQNGVREHYASTRDTQPYLFSQTEYPSSQAYQGHNIFAASSLQSEVPSPYSRGQNFMIGLINEPLSTPQPSLQRNLDVISPKNTTEGHDFVQGVSPVSTSTMALGVSGSERRSSSTISDHSTDNESVGKRKRAVSPPVNENGDFYCDHAKCTEQPRPIFKRKCEWQKHVDKHNRPHKCDDPRCAALKGFTYSGGLSRHKREVHGTEGGLKERLFCPHKHCKRAEKPSLPDGGKYFTRRENLNEHKRRCHTGPDGEPVSDGDSDESSHSLAARKRKSRADSMEDGAAESDCKEDIKRQVKRRKRKDPEDEEKMHKMQATIAMLQKQMQEMEQRFGTQV